MGDEKKEELVVSFNCPKCKGQDWIIDNYYWEANCLICGTQYSLIVVTNPKYYEDKPHV